MLRVLGFLFVGIFFFPSESMAFNDDVSTASFSNDVSPASFSTPKKQKIENDENARPNIVQVQNVAPVTPTKDERNFFSPIRKALAVIAYKNGEQKGPVSSPEVKEIYRKFDRGNYFTREITFQERRFLHVDPLFDPQAKVLDRAQGWITNLDRMKAGRPPIGRKGIADPKLPDPEIYKLQKRYRIELQHVTQKDKGEDNPICEMTSVGHHGLNARMILEIDKETGALRIVHSSLEETEVNNLLQGEQFSVADLLHFRDKKVGSFINRTEFAKCREAYWKFRAEKIEERNLIAAPLCFSPVNLFKSGKLDCSS